MPRNITVHFSDGTAHQYNNAPDVLTPDDIEKRTKKDYPNKKIVRIDGGKKKSDDSQSTPTDTKPGRGESKFSIKGLRFGMTKDEVIAITNPQNSNHSYNPATGKVVVTTSSIKDPNWFDALKGFSIGGMTNWMAGDVDNKLGYLMHSIPPDLWEEKVSLFSQIYGKPKITSSQVSTRMGFKDTNYNASWQVSDASIDITKYGSRIDAGFIMIASKDYYEKSFQAKRDSTNKASKDF